MVNLKPFVHSSFNFSFAMNTENELDTGNGIEADFAGFVQAITPSKAQKYGSLMSTRYVRLLNKLTNNSNSLFNIKIINQLLIIALKHSFYGKKLLGNLSTCTLKSLEFISGPVLRVFGLLYFQL